MPIRYEIDGVLGVIRTTGRGMVTDADVLAHKQSIVEDPRFRPGMKELSDFRQVEQLDVSEEGVRAMVAFDVGHNAQVNAHTLAILVSSDLAYGLARMYEQTTQGNTGGVNVFTDESKALRWLKLSEAGQPS